MKKKMDLRKKSLFFAALFFSVVPGLKAETVCASGQKLDTLTNRCITANSAVLISNDGTRTTFDQSGGTTVLSADVNHRNNNNSAALSNSGTFPAATAPTTAILAVETGASAT